MRDSRVNINKYNRVDSESKQPKDDVASGVKGTTDHASISMANGAMVIFCEKGLTHVGGK